MIVLPHNDRLRAWILHKERTWTGLRRGLLRFLPVLLVAGREFRRDLCFERAATLSFVAIISLMPLAVLFFSFAGLLGGGQKIIAYVEQRLFPMVAPQFHARIQEWLDANVSPTAFRGSSAGLVNVLAVIALVVAAMALLSTTERFFNLIWKAHTRRSYLRRMISFWVVLTTSPLLIAASMTIEGLMLPSGGWLHRMVKEYWVLEAVYVVVVPLVVGFLGFSLLYYLLPSTRVRWRSALMGGLAAAALWEVSKRAFFLYVAHAGTVSDFYGKLAFVPLFFVWVYITWAIILAGAEISHAHQNLPGLLRPGIGPDGERVYSRVFLGLSILVRLRDAFNVGFATPAAEILAADLAVPVESVEEIAELLVEHGFLIEDARRAGGYSLAADPAAIELDSVASLLLWREFPAEGELRGELSYAVDRGGDVSVARCLNAAWERYLESFQGLSLADLGPGPRSLRGAGA